MNLQRLQALRLQVVGVLATLDAEIAAEIDAQVAISEDAKVVTLHTMGQGEVESNCVVCFMPLSMCECP